MSVTAHQIRLVQESFMKAAPHADKLAEHFYKTLFEVAPGVRPLFGSDLRSQQRKLIVMLKAAVEGLNDLDALVPVLNDLAQRHVKYGAKPEHFTPVGNALIFSLKCQLGEKEFNSEVKEAWIAVIRLVASTMKQAMRPAA
ncbi:globin domain-containing protein [Shewanella submarina]|uniref:Globin family protein n=1 Tax=Shewanella submarina TaxID=2016376 RepID=A0ABV7GG50_9GAMM|nr:globin domain-containing protein [Shewanella submarina]